MPELLYGRGNGEHLARGTDFDNSSSKSVRIDNVDVFYSLFEVTMEEALEIIPTGLHPSIPAVMGVTFWRAQESSLGPFTIAFAALSCRTGIKPRHLVLKSYCNNDTAQHFFASRYGFNCEMADVFFQENYDRFYGRVICENKTVLETETSEALPLVGGGVAIKYSPPLNATQIDGTDVLVQFEAAYDFKRAARGKPKLVSFDGPIQAKSPVSGTHALCDIEFLPPRFSVDISVPAEEGGAKKIAR